jgi:hypothetical protein
MMFLIGPPPLTKELLLLPAVVPVVPLLSAVPVPLQWYC